MKKKSHVKAKKIRSCEGEILTVNSSMLHLFQCLSGRKTGFGEKKDLVITKKYSKFVIMVSMNRGKTKTTE